MEDLMTTRANWLKAFLAADIQTLKQIEVKDFIAVSERGIETSADRYTIIAARKEQGRWFKPSAGIRDIDVQLVARGDLYQVVGRSQVVAAEHVLRDLYINELWGRVGASWQIFSLHLSEVA